MQVDISDAGTLRKQLTVTYNGDEVAARREQILGRLASQVQLKGFRQGKVPKNLIERRYGQAADEDTAEQLIQEGVRQGVNQHQLDILGEIEPGERSADNGITASFCFDIKPEIALPDPESIKLAREVITIDDTEVDETLADLARRAGELGDLDGDTPLQADDGVTLSGTVTVDGAVIREVHDFHHLIGAYPLFGTEPEQVVELFADKSVGDAITFTTTLPEVFKPEEHAGKQAEVELTVQQAQRQQAAAIDDSLAGKVGAESLDDLKARIRASLEQQRSSEQHQQLVDGMMTQLLERAEFELPAHTLDQLTKDQIARDIHQAEHHDSLAGDELEAKKREIEEGAPQRAEHELRRFLIIDAIAKQFDVEVTREDLQQQIFMAAYRSGRKPDELAKQLHESGQINNVAHEIREGKAVELFLGKVLGEEAEDEHEHGPDCDHDHDDEAATAADDAKD